MHHKPYSSVISWSEEDEGFIAVAPELPGCSAFGETELEAIEQLKVAVNLWIEAAHEAGNPIPEPSPPPAINSYSGKVLLRMPKDLHARVAKSAGEQGVSLNQYLVYAIALNEMPEDRRASSRISTPARQPSPRSMRYNTGAVCTGTITPRNVRIVLAGMDNPTVDIAKTQYVIWTNVFEKGNTVGTIDPDHSLSFLDELPTLKFPHLAAIG